MHNFIIIILLNKDFVIYLTHGEDHDMIYCASLTHACYIVLFCHGSTEQDQAHQTDHSSDGFTMDKGIKPYFQFLYQQIKCIYVGTI